MVSHLSVDCCAGSGWPETPGLQPPSCCSQRWTSSCKSWQRRAPTAAGAQSACLSLNKERLRVCCITEQTTKTSILRLDWLLFMHNSSFTVSTWIMCIRRCFHTFHTLKTYSNLFFYSFYFSSLSFLGLSANLSLYTFVHSELVADLRARCSLFITDIAEQQRSLLEQKCN